MPLTTEQRAALLAVLAHADFSGLDSGACEGKLMQTRTIASESTRAVSRLEVLEAAPGMLAVEIALRDRVASSPGAAAALSLWLQDGGIDYSGAFGTLVLDQIAAADVGLTTELRAAVIAACRVVATAVAPSHLDEFIAAHRVVPQRDDILGILSELGR
jgi:hypothetical protein